MEIYELPLVFFTVFCQWGIGGALALTLLCWNGFGQVSGLQYRQLVLFFCIVTLFGSLASVAHLGTPTGAYRALSGLNLSWLSREVIAVMGLNALLVVWSALCWFRAESRAIPWVGLAASAVGIATIFMTSQVYYQLLSHPLWHTAATPLGFLGTAFLAGFVSLIIAYHYWHKSIPLLLNAGVIAGLFMIFVSLALRYRVPGADATSPLLWWQICASGLLTSWVLAKCSSTLILPIFGGGTLVLIISGELAGRMLFYSNVMRTYPWF